MTGPGASVVRGIAGLGVAWALNGAHNEDPHRDRVGAEATGWHYGRPLTWALRSLTVAVRVAGCCAPRDLLD